MDERKCDVLVIGAGTAGLNAYRSATAAGADVLIAEHGPGGSTCTRFGCMPSKLLLAAGRAAHDARHADRFGIRVQGIAVDGTAVLARMRRERDRFVRSVLDEYHSIPQEHRVYGEARFVAPDTVAVGDDLLIVSRAVVVAAGARPKVPPTLDPVRAIVHTHETIFEIAALPRALAVIGAGPLGLELAQAFARLGVAVTVLDEADVVGKLADPVAAKAARNALADAFELVLGVKVAAEMTGTGEARLSWTGATAGEVVVDCILAATGRPPNLKALALDRAGIPLDHEGVPCFNEESRRCGDTSIFVAGDVDAWRPVLHEAARGGRIAGHVAAGGADCRTIPRFQVAFTDPALVEVGVAFDKLPEGAIIGCSEVSGNGRARVDGHDAGVARLYVGREGKLIGATIVARDGEHLGHLVALGIDRGIAIADFADQPWYHPTLEEMLQEAARDAHEQRR